MSYAKHDFNSLDKLYASQLNEMDNQIAKNEQNAAKLSTVASNLSSNDNTQDNRIRLLEMVDFRFQKNFWNLKSKNG